MTDHNNTLEEGIEAIRRGDKTTARTIFRGILETDPDNVQALLWLAGVANSRAEKDRVLQQVLRVDPDNAVAQRGLDALGTPSAPPAAPSVPPTTRTPASTTVSAAAEPNDEAAAPSVAPLERDVVVLGATANRPKRRKRRGGLAAWLPLILALFACGIGGVFVARQTDLFNRLTGPRAAATATAERGEAAAVITDTAVAADLGPVLGDATTVAVAPGSALTSTTTINIPGVQAGASASGSAAPDASASVLAEPSIVAAAPSDAVVPAPSDVVAPAPSGTSPAPSIVGVVPSAVPEPSVVTAVPSAVPAPSVVVVVPPSGEAATSSGAPATGPAVSPTASGVLSVPSAAASPAPGSVAAAPSSVPGASASSAVPATAANGVARPVVIDPKQHSIAADTWRWSYFGLSNVSTGRGYSAPPTNGRYLIVLLVMQNLGTTPQQIPDGLYVVTDDQGRSIPFNRQASEDYFLQAGIGVAANYAPTANIPPTESWVSVPLLFDVPPDATNLIVSSTSTPAQGYLVRQNMQQ